MQIIYCRWEFPSAGGIPQCARNLSQNFGIFQRSKAVKTEAAMVWCGLSGRDGFEHASFAHPEAVAVATFLLFALILLSKLEIL